MLNDFFHLQWQRRIIEIALLCLIQRYLRELNIFALKTGDFHWTGPLKIKVTHNVK